MQDTRGDYERAESYRVGRYFNFGPRPWVHYSKGTTMNEDGTLENLHTDPLTRRFKGETWHGSMKFDVPFMTQVANNLYHGGCVTGLVLPTYIKHVVSLYPWEKYKVTHELDSETYVRMRDAVNQDTKVAWLLAEWVNECRRSGPVLVHCQAGLNRSSLVVARALFISDENNDPATESLYGDGNDIVEMLRELRSPAVLCNSTFEAEVRSWT